VARPVALENSYRTERSIRSFHAALQRSLSLHRKLRAFDHGRGDHEPERARKLHGLQRGESSHRGRATEAIRQIEKAGLSAADTRSKSWDKFSKPDSPHLSFVFTVCDNAANEVCPFWPGQPMTAHWGIPDPAFAQGSPAEIERAYSQAFQALDRRISLFLCLPFATIDAFALQEKLNDIGKS
jgi:arsenate reductase